MFTQLALDAKNIFLEWSEVRVTVGSQRRLSLHIRKSINHKTQGRISIPLRLRGITSKIFKNRNDKKKKKGLALEWWNFAGG